MRITASFAGPRASSKRLNVPALARVAPISVEVSGMNEDLEIVGTYFDSNNAYHSFIRWPQGKFKTFECPSAGAGRTDLGRGLRHERRSGDRGNVFRLKQCVSQLHSLAPGQVQNV